MIAWFENAGGGHVVLRARSSPTAPSVRGMGTYVIARLVAVADVGALGALGAELSSVRAVAAAMTAGGHPLRVLHATYVAAQQSFQCVVAAEDAATVLEALRRVGTHTARVLPALSL